MFLLKKDLKTVLSENQDKIFRFVNAKYQHDAVVDLHFSGNQIWCRYHFGNDGYPYLEEWYILQDQDKYLTLFADDITATGEFIDMTAADVETFEKNKTKHLRGL
jgi:hypothetical protein